MVFMSPEVIRAVLLANVVEDRPGSCWEWQGYFDRRGYALCWINGRQCRAARVAYELWVGPILPDHDLHHTCERRDCVNPAHLQPMEHGKHLRLHAATGAWAGERNGRAKLTEKDALFIRLARVAVKDLAIQFEVSERTIFHIKSGAGWRHIKPPEFLPRSIEEIKRKCEAVGRRTLDVFLSVQQDRREREQPQPPMIEQSIRLARVCAGL